MVRRKFTARLLVMGLVLLCFVSACAPVATPASSSPPSPTFTVNSPTSIPTVTPLPPTPTATPTPQVSLSGRIVDNETGEPIVEANVSVSDQTATTNTKGEYALAGLPPGQVVLSVTVEGYDPGLSPILTLTAGAPQVVDLTLFPINTSSYPSNPMLTNPVDPNGAPTPEEAERLARLQGLTDGVISIEETKLRGEFLVNYKIGDDVRAAVADLSHEVWKLTDDTGQVWYIIKVCGNLATRMPQEVTIPTPESQPQPVMAEVLVDELTLYSCASEECDEAATVPLGTQVEVGGCLADGGWCQVSWDGVVSWCTGNALRQLAVVEVEGPTATIASAEVRKIAFLSTRDHLGQPSPNFEVYLMNSDGSQQTRVTRSGLCPYSGCSLSWMPDITQLYVSCGSPSNSVELSESTINPWDFSISDNGQFAQFSPDGSEKVKLADVFARQSSWSPDGTRIAFECGIPGVTQYPIPWTFVSSTARA
ncbi:MAG: carboxypeptidase regulatory-like domain-containing protein [Anaerolineae bacterium]|nr:carboxypeptidase regulatory-like domain-containing protein [Anaerolineae bacterium]